MSETTNLKLKKHDDVLENTNAFNIEEYLNDNWGKIDENIEQINEKIKQNSNNIESLQADNTTNKKSIEELKQKNAEQDESVKTNASEIENLKQENIEIKAENERLRDDIKSIALVGEESGESIDLEDSSEARFNKFEIGGNHKQETREGYNILDLGKKPYNEQASSLNGATVTQKNGILTIDAMNATDLVTVKSVWKSYTDSTNIKMPKGNYYTPLTLNISKVESGESVGQKTGNFTLEEDCVCTQWFYNVGKGKKIELPLFISNNQNKTAYEQYGATPSLKIPSKIKTVKDNINLTVANKNYINIENTSKTINGITFTVNSDGSILANGTATDRVSYPIQNNFKKFEAGQYFVSGCPNGGSEATYYLILWNENWFSMGSEYGKGRLVSLSNQKVKLHINIMKGTVCNNLLFKPQMEKETKATDYEAHQEQAITMPTQQEMLQGDYFDWVNEKEVHKWAKLIFDGTENWLQSGNVYPTFYISPDEIASKFGIPTNLKALCNYFTQKSNIWGIDEIGFDIANLRPDHVDFRFCLGSNSTITTLEAWKNKLVEMYNSGNPLVLYFQIFTQDELDFTDEQKAVAKKIKEILHTYKNITHIYSTDETSPIMNVEYAKDLNTQNNNLQNQIDEIKQLISTTQTSAMLLDNLQKEVESEVE